VIYLKVTYAFFFRKYKEVLGIKKLMDKKKVLII